MSKVIEIRQKGDFKKSLTFFSVGSKTIFACIFFRYVFKFGRRRIFNGVCAGNDLAVCIEFVVEFIE